MATPKKKKTLSTLDCMIHCTNNTDDLETLESMESWETLLLPAHICNHLIILKV